MGRERREEEGGEEEKFIWNLKSVGQEGGWVAELGWRGREAEGKVRQ